MIFWRLWREDWEKMSNASNETKIKVALSHVLTNVSNYPDDVQARLLGARLDKVIDAAVEAVLSSGAVEPVNALYARPLVDRVEVIDSSGRMYVNMDAGNVVSSLQDGGKTFKVFVGEKL
jgi:hypothetical protein